MCCNVGRYLTTRVEGLGCLHASADFLLSPLRALVLGDHYRLNLDGSIEKLNSTDSTCTKVAKVFFGLIGTIVLFPLVLIGALLKFVSPCCHSKVNEAYSGVFYKPNELYEGFHDDIKKILKLAEEKSSRLPIDKQIITNEQVNVDRVGLKNTMPFSIDQITGLTDILDKIPDKEVNKNFLKLWEEHAKTGYNKKKYFEIYHWLNTDNGFDKQIRKYLNEATKRRLVNQLKIILIGLMDKPSDEVVVNIESLYEAMKVCDPTFIKEAEVIHQKLLNLGDVEVRLFGYLGAFKEDCIREMLGKKGLLRDHWHSISYFYKLYGKELGLSTCAADQDLFRNRFAFGIEELKIEEFFTRPSDNCKGYFCPERIVEDFKARIDYQNFESKESNGIDLEILHLLAKHAEKYAEYQKDLNGGHYPESIEDTITFETISFDPAAPDWDSKTYARSVFFRQKEEGSPMCEITEDAVSYLLFLMGVLDSLPNHA